MKIKTYSGEIEGIFENHLFQFKGVPYAKANRFQKPESIQWDTCLDCTHFRAKSPQIEKDNPYYQFQGEDCLNLNIYTPTLKKNLPVLIEIHGGAFQKGHNQKMYPEHVIGNDEFIYVTINYRLGVFGYLYLGQEQGEDYQTSGNNGLLDQIAAIQWVYKNIEHFGGNNQKITLLGSSAGAKSIAAIMLLPEANQFFQQVILMSGAYQSIRDIHTAQTVTQQFLKHLRIKDSRDLIHLPFTELLNAQKKLCQSIGSTCYFGPVADGCTISVDYLKNLKHFPWNGNVIIGSSLHEMGVNLSSIEEIKNTVEQLFGKNKELVINDFNQIKQLKGNTYALDKVFSDYMYRTYAYRFAKILSINNNVYQYASALSPAYHCQDHSIAFKPFYAYPDHLKHQSIQLVGKQIRDNFIHFVLYQHPKELTWLPLSTSQSQMVWDNVSYVEKISDNDVLQNIPEQVFIL